MIFYCGDSIPLTFSRIAAGVGVTGLAVTVRVVNVRTDAVLLATTTMVESVNAGLYRFVWSVGVPVLATDCLAIYTVSGRIYHEFFKVDDLRDRMDNADGRAI